MGPQSPVVLGPLCGREVKSHSGQVYGEELLEDRAVFERAISAAEYLHEQSPAVKPSPNGSGCARGETGQSGWGGARVDDEETEEMDKNEYEDQQGLCLGGFTRCRNASKLVTQLRF